MRLSVLTLASVHLLAACTISSEPDRSTDATACAQGTAAPIDEKHSREPSRLGESLFAATIVVHRYPVSLFSVKQQWRRDRRPLRALPARRDAGQPNRTLRLAERPAEELDSLAPIAGDAPEAGKRAAHSGTTLARNFGTARTATTLTTNARAIAMRASASTLTRTKRQSTSAQPRTVIRACATSSSSAGADEAMTAARPVTIAPAARTTPSIVRRFLRPGSAAVSNAGCHER